MGGDVRMQPNTNPAPVGKLNRHDVEVIIFHVLIAMAQAGLMALGAENYGKYTPEVAMGVQILSELIRRLSV